jgi:WD40 repeat protein
VSSSKDGFLKFWDLQQQCCISSYSDEILDKVNDFVIVPELKLLIIGSGASTQSHDSSYLKVYEVQMDNQSFELQLKSHSKLKKESSSKVIELQYENSQRLISCLSADNKIEYFRVNIDNQEAILKKMIRIQKRQNLKRKKVEQQEEESGADERPVE